MGGHKSKRSTTVYLDPELHRRARVFGLERDESLSDLVERGLRSVLEQRAPTVAGAPPAPRGRAR